MAARRSVQQLPQAERAGLIAQGESCQLIRLLEQEVRLGYWPPTEFDWMQAVRTVGELAALAEAAGLTLIRLRAPTR